MTLAYPDGFIYDEDAFPDEPFVLDVDLDCEDLPEPDAAALSRGPQIEPSESRSDWARRRNEWQREADRPDGEEGDPGRQVFPGMPEEGRADVLRGQVLRDRGSRPKVSAVRFMRGGEEVAVRLGTDVDAIRAFIAERADAELAELLRPSPRGRLTLAERERRDLLAVLVAKAVAAGATLRAVGEAIGRPVSVVASLVERGDALGG